MKTFNGNQGITFVETKKN